MLTTEPQSESRPDWGAIEHEVECPLCEYNLRGLSEPRCPECGYKFSWEEILDPRRAKHEYLFEHHPERNWWSWGKTLVGGWRPGRFWKALHPVLPARGMRLFLYAALILVIGIAPGWVEKLVGAAQPTNWMIWFDTWRGKLAQRTVREFPLGVVVDAMGLAQSANRVVYGYVIATLALPVLMYLLLMIFQGTMRRARVRPRHVLRCVVYSADVLIWPAIPLLVLVCAGAFSVGWGEAMTWWAMVMFPVVWVTMAWRLGCAYQHYLRFNHAWATVMSVQVILVMVWMLVSLTRYW